MATAFQPSAFQNNAFQIDGGVVVPPVTTPPPHPHGAALVTGRAGGRRRHVRLSAMFMQAPADWYAELTYDDEELAIALLLGVLE